MTSPIQTALISVSDKTGVVEFAQGLVQRGVRVLSTGGTAKLLVNAGLTVIEVARHTGSPEILDGRVKTLHPKIHAGLLARRGDAAHAQTLAEHDIAAIDLLVVNLYPFRQTIERPDCTLAQAVENIDVGGPAMLRAAAKNHGDAAGGVTVVCEPNDYPLVLQAMDDAAGSVQNSVDYALRLKLATKAFAHTAAYDGAVAAYLSSLVDAAPAPDTVPQRQPWPRTVTLQMHRKDVLRYGENPHQAAAFYVGEQFEPEVENLATFSHFTQHQGKELSYNNLTDAHAAWACVCSLTSSAQTPNACVIVKHANPCGAALGASAQAAYQQAYKTDPTSAFGGIIAFNCFVDEPTARAMVAQQFMEVLLAPAFSAEALGVLAQKKNVRVLQVPLASVLTAAHKPAHNDFDASGVELKRISGGWLAQTPDDAADEHAHMRVVTRVAPTAAQWQDLLFAWQIARHVKSNAIVFAAEQSTLGIGAGQMSRVDSARIAAIKAGNIGLSLQGSAVASDAFFPFRDGLDVVAQAGAHCVIQPGGSVRDDEVIAAADEHGIALVLTGVRHFLH